MVAEHVAAPVRNNNQIAARQWTRLLFIGELQPRAAAFDHVKVRIIAGGQAHRPGRGKFRTAKHTSAQLH
jgi:hypothetical protein